MPNVRPPASAPKAIVKRGVLGADAGSVRSILYTLGQKIKRDPKLARQFQDDPRKVLRDLGLNLDVQTEAIQSLGVELPEGCASTCAGMTCAVTCWITSFAD
jgi:hypothetical protein